MNLERRIQKLEGNQAADGPWSLPPIVIYSHDGVVTETLLDGQPYTGFGLTGYDNVSGRYWSTWNDSMNTGLTVAEGSCTAQATCSFIGHWNDAVTKQQASARMELRWTSPAVEVFEMFGAGPDGKEMKMMEITYTRR